MRNIWTIALRDFRSNFTSPVAYVVIAGFLLIMGWMFFFSLEHFSMQNLRFSQGPRGQSISITDGIVRPFYGNMNVILLFIVPFITMRLFAEEKKNHTIELLFTTPVTVMQMVLAKNLSAFLMILVMLLLTSVYPLVLFITGNPDPGPILTSYLGTFLLAGCYTAMGVFFSSMTENQIIAAILTFAGMLFFWIISWASQAAGPVLSEVLQYLSLITHFTNFSKGVINTSDLTFYLSFIFVGWFLTYRVIESYRWR